MQFAWYDHMNTALTCDMWHSRAFPPTSTIHGTGISSDAVSLIRSKKKRGSDNISLFALELSHTRWLGPRFWACLEYRDRCDSGLLPETTCDESSGDLTNGLLVCI